MGFTSYGRAVKHNRYPGPRRSRAPSDESWRAGCLCSERRRLPVGFRSDSLSWKNWIGREPDFDRLPSFYTEHLPLRWAGPKRRQYPRSKRTVQFFCCSYPGIDAGFTSKRAATRCILTRPCVCQHGRRLGYQRDLCHTVVAITVGYRCVDDNRPSDTGGRLYSHGDGSPLPVLLGSNGVGRRELDFSRLGTMGDCSAFDSRFFTWPDQRAHDGTIPRSDDAGRSRLGGGRADSWYSGYPLGGCFSLSYYGPWINAVF